MKFEFGKNAYSFVALFLFSVAIAVVLCLAAPSALAAPGPGPQACAANSGARQLDFWLGDWTIQFDGATRPSASTVSLSLDKCLLVESWKGPDGHAGETIFAYSVEENLWHGMFVDNEGRAHAFEGKVAAGKGEFLGPSIAENGEKVMNRIRLVRQPDGSVEHSWEKSTDNGATWKTTFRGHYAQAKR